MNCAHYNDHTVYLQNLFKCSPHQIDPVGCQQRSEFALEVRLAMMTLLIQDVGPEVVGLRVPTVLCSTFG